MYQQPPSVGRHVLYQVILFCTSLVVLYPILWVVKIALTPSQAFSMDPWPFPFEIFFENKELISESDTTRRIGLIFESNATLENFKNVTGFGQDMPSSWNEIQELTRGEKVWMFGYQLFNSLIVSILTSIVGVILSCTSAYAMSRFAFPGRDAGMSFFLVTQMFPGVVMAIPLYILMEQFGLLNSISGLALAYASTAIPFCTWNLKGYFDTIPKELEEAARMDGASQWVIFTQIVLPLSKPALAVTALFSFMTAWNEFILAQTFISDETAYTLPVLLNSYVGDYNTEWGNFAAGAIIASVPVMLLFFMLQRYLVEGLTAGAVKG
ncbi:MAG: ABC transporter [Deltaproteobacteria bacterium]|nr:ABC transporter [Deltaproteobacteria bacterium]